MSITVFISNKAEDFKRRHACGFAATRDREGYISIAELNIELHLGEGYIPGPASC